MRRERPSRRLDVCVVAVLTYAACLHLVHADAVSQHVRQLAIRPADPVILAIAVRNCSRSWAASGDSSWLSSAVASGVERSC